ncbi:Predicted ATPase [Leclercia adecarboxylata]|uniref:Predicted ATPase n=1 Tax=Leclercia adecarboxylata TaxID=83655 RepID=A0A4U9HHB2_9ENTR|nr:Predicted ATPase [Leclercia adecarboxylata]
MPELRLLLDNKPRFTSDTFSIDTRARFSHMVLALVKAFASAGCPLVLLLDDIHWIDAASLQILEYLLIHASTVPLLMVVAHRDACSLPDSALHHQLANLHLASRNTTELRPEPLSVKAVSLWLANIFHIRSASTLDLAGLIHEKPAATHCSFMSFSADRR